MGPSPARGAAEPAASLPPQGSAPRGRLLPSCICACPPAGGGPGGCAQEWHLPTLPRPGPGLTAHEGGRAESAGERAAWEDGAAKPRGRGRRGPAVGRMGSRWRTVQRERPGEGRRGSAPLSFPPPGFPSLARPHGWQDDAWVPPPWRLRAEPQRVAVPVGLSPVPRLRFEDWTYEDFRNVLDSEDEIEELSRTVVQVAKVTPLWGRTPARGFPSTPGAVGAGAAFGDTLACRCWALRTPGLGSRWGRRGSPAPLRLALCGAVLPPSELQEVGLAPCPPTPSSRGSPHPPRSLQSQRFDGFVVEVWNQLLIQKHV